MATATQPLISVIVPVYKSEKYLRKCVESIRSQTYQNLEIILVDDESPESSGAIADEYAALDQRVSVIHKTFGPLSSSRNAGLDIANGEFAAFVDSDDYIEPAMYEKLYSAISNSNADVAVCGFSLVYEDYSGYVKAPQISKIYPTELYKEYLRNYLAYFPLMACAWNKLFRRSFLENSLVPCGSALRFNEELKYCEDVWFSADWSEAANNGVVFVPENLYNYTQSVNTTSLAKSDVVESELASFKHLSEAMLRLLPDEHKKIEKLSLFIEREKKMVAVHKSIIYNIDGKFHLSFNDLLVIIKYSKDYRTIFSAILIFFFPKRLYRFAFKFYSKYLSKSH
jgi:glycosyltransferase involved in cell wall biosynthesis